MLSLTGESVTAIQQSLPYLSKALAGASGLHCDSLCCWEWAESVEGNPDMMIVVPVPGWFANFYRGINAVFVALGLPIVFIVSAFFYIRKKLNIETVFQQKYGANWEAEYTRVHGSLADSHQEMFTVAIGVLIVSVLFVVLCFLLAKPNGSNRSPRGRSGKHWY